MSGLDYAVLFGTLLVIAIYGWWKTHSDHDLGHYLQGDSSIRWGTIGLSVMATQASAITFLSTPGQAYESGMGFLQNYFGLPFALIVVCAVFIPIYHRLKVVTAYEYLGQRFDQKTRLLGAFLFLLQRGLAAGITLYAPAIILSTLLGWNLRLTILLAGLFVVLYTTSGGTTAVSHTQKWQMAVILAGMGVAFGMILHRLPADCSFLQAVSVAGKMGKLNAVDFSFDFHRRYTFWSGLLGGFFLALSYFGTDQSQVQRYLAGGSLAGSRFGLLFNAVLKLPMQFFILFTGVMVFIFFQFEKPPIFFNGPAYQRAAQGEQAGKLATLQARYDHVFAQKEVAMRGLTTALESRSAPTINSATNAVLKPQGEIEAIRGEVKETLKKTRSESANQRRGLRLHQLCPELSAAWRDRTARCRDFLCRDVLQRFGTERARLDNGGGFLSPAAASERERWSLSLRFEIAHGRLGRSRHLFRTFRQPPREPDPGDQHSRFDFLWQYSRNLSGRIFSPLCSRLCRLRRRAHFAGARPDPLLHHEYWLPLVQRARLRRGLHPFRPA